MRKNVVISLYWNYGEQDENAFPDAPELGKEPHAQEAMRHMGITYSKAEPNPIADCWVFFDCKNIPDGPHPKWMTVFDGGMTAQERYDKAMAKVRSDPEPEGQIFPVGSRVKIADDLGPHMKHFNGAGRNATVLYTYAHAFGGSDAGSYALDVDGVGYTAWYKEEQLTSVPH